MRPTPTSCAAFAALMFVTAAAANTVDVTVSSCQPGVVTVSLTRSDNSLHQYPILIPVPMTATQKRDHIMNWMLANTAWPVSAIGANKLRIDGGVVGIKQATLATGTTAEVEDRVVAPLSISAGIAYVGHFEPLVLPGQPALFTAGIVTDVGEVTVRVSAQELNFQTDGPIICQALFQRLAPRAPQYGAQINYAGDRLEVYFDPAYTVTQGGIIFGTNSPSQGSSGMLLLPPPAPPIRRGDMNCDSVVDFFDIDPFLMALFDAGAYAVIYPECNRMAADLNGDGVVDFFDIDPFLDCIFLGNCGR